MPARLAPILLLLAFGAAAQDEDDEALARVQETEIDCKNPESFTPLFELAASGTIEGTDSSEELADANEAAFLKCPYPFLLALKNQARETQDGVVTYFGIRHPPPELGQELKKWKNHPQVGPLVRSRFAGFLDAPKK